MASVLESLTINLNKKAKDNKLDPVIGRSNELSRLTSILLKRTKNNPILLGSAGVGKTAIVEELARSIVNETCHHDLLDKQILLLDTVGLLSGTQERGSLEYKATQLLKEIDEREDIILMIDEIHMIVSHSNISARGEGNSLNIANMFKPGLSRGKIRCIGATTLDEYQKFFLNDKALDRRFQPIMVNEPSMEDTRQILMTLKSNYEEYHCCEIHEESIDRSLELSDRYLHYRQFPDKAIDVIDEACSKLNIQYRLDNRKDKILRANDIDLVMEQIITSPLKLDGDENKLFHLEEALKENIIGQDETIDTIMNTLKRHVCGFYNPKRPLASMLFMGPTGTGKTETVNLIADHYYGSREKNIIRFDMSEYMEDHSISTLIGSPPGYIGYSEGGELTNAIKRNPYSIVLFDEIEKAHPKIFNLLLQIMEDGILSDNNGKTFSFRNAVVIMTSNIGFTHKARSQLGFNESTNIQCCYNRDNALNELKYTFRPEFLNRIDLISIFEYLSSDSIRTITKKMIDDTIQEIYNTKEIQVFVTNETRELLYSYGEDSSYGARPIRKGITELIINPISEMILKDENLKNTWINI